MSAATEHPRPRRHRQGRQAAEARRSRRGSRRRSSRSCWCAAAFLPFFFDSGDTFIQTCTQALAYIVMALGLNIVVGFAGLLDLGYVAFFAIGAYTAGYFGSGFFSKVGGGEGIHILVTGLRLQAARHPRQLPDHPGAGGHHDRGRGHDHRPADAAPARRLHRDRDARLRRDHRPHRGQRRRHRDPRPAAHGRPPGHLAGGQDRPAVPRAVRAAGPETLVLVRPGPGGLRAVRELPPARLAARPRVGRPARGRDRGRRHGRPGRQDEAAGLRHRRRHGRHRGRVPRLVPEHGERRPVPVLLLDPGAGHDHPRRPRLDLGRGARRGRAVVHQHLADPGRHQLVARASSGSTSTRRRSRSRSTASCW